MWVLMFACEGNSFQSVPKAPVGGSDANISAEDKLRLEARVSCPPVQRRGREKGESALVCVRLCERKERVDVHV